MHFFCTHTHKHTHKHTLCRGCLSLLRREEAMEGCYIVAIKFYYVKNNLHHFVYITGFESEMKSKISCWLWWGHPQMTSHLKKGKWFGTHATKLLINKTGRWFNKLQCLSLQNYSYKSECKKNPIKLMLN